MRRKVLHVMERQGERRCTRLVYSGLVLIESPEGQTVHCFHLECHILISGQNSSFAWHDKFFNPEFERHPTSVFSPKAVLEPSNQQGS